MPWRDKFPQEENVTDRNGKNEEQENKIPSTKLPENNFWSLTVT
jgi:hypothetical protein